MKTRIENFAGIVNNCDERWLRQTLLDNLQKAGFSVIGFIDHQFDKYGYTALWLLGESHLALHTFPENSNAYIELSSCLPKKGELFWENFNQEAKYYKESKKIMEV